jgi:rhodanese-related sulfurtransferase
MQPRRITPEAALDLMEKQGYVYVDVRSIPEFAQGHPEGAYNVPLQHLGPAGMTPNPDFMSVMQKAFPRDAKLVLGCKAGGRSLAAATMLLAAGFTNVVDQRCGFEGAPSPARGFDPGWRPKGLPVSQAGPADHTWEGLRSK